MSASNVRLIAILCASLAAGYAGDEAYNVWWASPTPRPAAEVVVPEALVPEETSEAKLALAEPLQKAK
ncbi:MAG: hypothetical protein L0211_08120 [Planctomycetaceae bacterium]|nr:hypothetical protein [Planctomycetaceae bacterium]